MWDKSFGAVMLELCSGTCSTTHVHPRSKTKTPSSSIFSQEVQRLKGSCPDKMIFRLSESGVRHWVLCCLGCFFVTVRALPPW